jgi:15-cis-phytoene synthase
MSAAASPRRAAVIEARTTTRRAGRTFALACRLLPRALRDDVYLLYLVFRRLDDLVDDGLPEASARLAAVEAWARRRPGEATPEVVVLDALAGRHPLPRSAFAEFCTGMRQDLARATFATEADVDDYCYQVAGTVGLLITAVLGVRDERRAAPAAAALGIAMQRTNILRDIDEDLARGRVYLSQRALARHGSPLPGRRSALLREQIAYADQLYEIGLDGVDALRRGRRAIAAAGASYQEILRQLERDGYGATAGRATVPTPRRLAVAGLAACRA